MNEPKEKVSSFAELLKNKVAARKSVLSGDLSKKFRPGEKAQPIIRRGGRNGSGKP